MAHALPPRLSAALFCAVLTIAVGCPMGPREIEYTAGRKAHVTADGLHRIDSRSSASNVFVKPGTDLSVYTAVMLDPVRIRYGRGSTRHLQSNRMETLEGHFRDAFLKELGKSEFYTLVTAPGPHVLRITAQIVDFVITDPEDTAPSTQTDVFVDSSGAMTLILDATDSRTHEPLFRAASRQAVKDPTGHAYQSSPTKNLANARILFRHWA